MIKLKSLVERSVVRYSIAWNIAQENPKAKKHSQSLPEYGGDDEKYELQPVPQKKGESMLDALLRRAEIEYAKLKQWVGTTGRHSRRIHGLKKRMITA